MYFKLALFQISIYNREYKKQKEEKKMKIKTIGKEIEVTDAINDYVEKKLGRVDKQFDEASAEVTLKVQKNEQTAEIYVTANGERYRAVTEDKDLYAAIDKDIDILEGQIRKSKTKKEKMMKGTGIKSLEVQKEIPEIENQIVKTAYYEIKPITPEDAMLELQEKPTHNFLTFINVDTGKVTVIHRLKDGKNYGLIEPEAQENIPESLKVLQKVFLFWLSVNLFKQICSYSSGGRVQPW